MKILGNPSSSRLSPAALAASWGLMLLMLTWLGWRDYRDQMQHQPILAHQAVNGAARIATLYFRDAGHRLLQLLEQEEDLLVTLKHNPDRGNTAARLTAALRYRFHELDGFALADERGNILALDPEDYPTPRRERMTRLFRAEQASVPVHIQTHDGDYRFDLTAPWYRDGKLAGALLITLNCNHLCSSLRSQAPERHSLGLQPLTGDQESDSPKPLASVTLPGTHWMIVDRMEPWTLGVWLRESLLPRLLPLALLVIATVLLYSGARHRAQKLADHNQRFRSLFGQGTMSQLVVAADSGLVLEANRAATTFFDRNKARLQQQGVQALLDTDTAALEAGLARARSGEKVHFHIPYTSLTGEKRELAVDIGEIDPPGSGLLHLALSDVTRQRDTLEALRESEEKLVAILDASADGIVITDEEGIVQAFSPAAEMIFGYLQEEMLSRPIGLLIPACCSGERDGGLEEWILKGLATGMSAMRELTGERKSCEEIPIRVSLSQVTLSGRRHFVVLIQDLTELHRNEEQLAYLERQDALTGLLNRREFERRLDALLSFAEHPDTNYLLCHIDVDQFKLVNDTCGHRAGDELLKQLTVLIQSQLRESETVARVGGDEFAALFTDCTLARGEEICRPLLQTVRNFLFAWRDQSFDVVISIGITGFRPHVETASQIISQGDVACQMAKQLGGNRLHVYHRNDVELIRHHRDMHLVSTINQALNEGRFHLYAQPIVPVAGKSAQVHYEILARMMDENDRPLIPDKFVPAAERYILMPAIDRWVINHLFSTQAGNLHRWAQRYPRDRGFLFSINLSGTSLAESGFLSYIKRQFSDHGIPYRSICFEITETAMVAHLGRAKKLIEELRDLGCSFALDDFGTGLSSYAYLKILPVDYLKIDGSFVRNMAKDPVDYAMVESINQIGHILGLKTIAEWTENQSTMTHLRALDVDFAQGYGVGETILLEDFRLPESDADAAVERD